jgi:hypothetical protein
MMRSIYIQYRACAALITSKRQLKSPAIIKVRFPVSQTFYCQIPALSQPFISEMWQIVCDLDFARCSKSNAAIVVDENVVTGTAPPSLHCSLFSYLVEAANTACRY